MKLDMLFQLTGRKRRREIAKIIVGYQQAFILIVGYQQAFISHIGKYFKKNYKKCKIIFYYAVGIVFSFCLYPKYLVINKSNTI